jgi:hypothetical protein
MKIAYEVSSRGENADAAISNICICIIRLSLLGICIIIRTVIKYGYYPLSAYVVMKVLNYYVNLYTRLNNVIITICKLK